MGVCKRQFLGRSGLEKIQWHRTLPCHTLDPCPGSPTCCKSEGVPRPAPGQLQTRLSSLLCFHHNLFPAHSRKAGSPIWTRRRRRDSYSDGAATATGPPAHRWAEFCYTASSSIPSITMSGRLGLVQRFRCGDLDSWLQSLSIYQRQAVCYS
jgi:hypothetical protein